MEYFIGALIPVLALLILYFGYMLGQQNKVKKSKPPSLTEEKQQEIERWEKHFQSIMKYDETQAMKRKGSDLDE